MNNNISFSLVDANINEKVETDVTYENLLDKVNKESDNFQIQDFNMDDYIALELNYNENYTKKDFFSKVLILFQEVQYLFLEK